MKGGNNYAFIEYRPERKSPQRGRNLARVFSVRIIYILAKRPKKVKFLVWGWFMVLFN